MKTDKTGTHVACCDKTLILEEIQIEGKKRMDADAFFLGVPCRDRSEILR